QDLSEPQRTEFRYGEDLAVGGLGPGFALGGRHRVRQDSSPSVTDSGSWACARLRDVVNCQPPVWTLPDIRVVGRRSSQAGHAPAQPDPAPRTRCGAGFRRPLCTAAQDAPRRTAPTWLAASATAASRATVVSSTVSVRSGARNRSVYASDLRPGPACSPVYTSNSRISSSR